MGRRHHVDKLILAEEILVLGQKCGSNDEIPYQYGIRAKIHKMVKNAMSTNYFQYSP